MWPKLRPCLYDAPVPGARFSNWWNLH